MKKKWKKREEYSDRQLRSLACERVIPLHVFNSMSRPDLIQLHVYRQEYMDLMVDREKNKAISRLSYYSTGGVPDEG